MRLLVGFLFLAAAAMAGDEYHLLKKIAVAGDYGWDYLTADSEGRRLYVSHDREVVVLDLDSGAALGKIPGRAFTASPLRGSWAAVLSAAACLAP